MTAQERFEKQMSTLDDLADEDDKMFCDAIKRVRSAHAACVKEATNAHTEEILEIRREAFVRGLREGAARVDWRNCFECGKEWPHPSCRSEVNCSDCRAARAKRRGAERLRHRIASKLADINQNDKLNRADMLGIVDDCWARSKGGDATVPKLEQRRVHAERGGARPLGQRRSEK